MSSDLSPRDELAAELVGMMAAWGTTKPVAMAEELMRLGYRKTPAAGQAKLGTFHRDRQQLTHGQAGAIAGAAHSMLDHVRDLEDMLAGRGAHVDHERKQIGRCVVCSCGARAQGRAEKR